jgi:hypothetical protein
MMKRSLTTSSIQGEDTAWVSVDFVAPHPSGDDWIGIFSPSNFKYTSLFTIIQTLNLGLQDTRSYVVRLYLIT